MSNITGTMTFTSGKKINFELYPEIAPISVANFVELAKQDFYSGVCFHRCINGFMVQGGGFKAEGGALVAHESNKTIKGEFRSNGVANTLSHTPGVFSMARTSVKDSASSQFFICVAPTPFLDGEYAAFGKATDEESVAVAVEMSKVKTTSWSYYDDVPVEPIVIESVMISE